jgi:Mlc titration factor MtfA (ptsG expression regulator)
VEDQDIDLNHKELAQFYARYFHYYNTLDASGQELFVNRSLQFISEKKISGAEGFAPDNRVKALVTASAIQLTLGLETWHLNYFNDIEIHPADFGMATGETKFKGRTDLGGNIKLSWKSFLHGYQIDDDNLNLGLHEFSHALRLNGIRGYAQDYFIENYFDKWISCAMDAFNDLRNQQPSIFRKYGSANINEFLSVCIEHYFESPEEIKESYPLLYYATGILLNQHSTSQATQLGIRNAFLLEQNQLLSGFKKQRLQSTFLAHWSFRLWIFVLAILIYAFSTSGAMSINIGLSLVFVLIFLWYEYVAVSMEFEGAEVRIKKGNGLFKNRMSRTAMISQLISIRTEEKEWSVIYYDPADRFFYKESVSPPKGVKPVFLLECRQNKIALFKEVRS